MNNKYRDMIMLPHYVSPTRAQMSAKNRAAQFAPFAALTGYDSVIAETARTTSEKPELSKEMQELINSKLQMIVDRIDEAPGVTVTYFVRDELKSGGAYNCAKGYVKRIDGIERTLCFTDGRTIPLDDILDIAVS